MRYWTTFFIALFFIALLPLSVGPRAQGEFRGAERDLRAWCEIDKELCLHWIQGVMEGMELVWVIVRPADELKKRPTVFCIDESDENYLDKIRMGFMEEDLSGESSGGLDDPAVIALLPVFSKYLCKNSKV